MPTKKPRVNITLEPSEEMLLSSMAKKEHISVSSLVKELISEALELREDWLLSEIADKRDKPGKKRISHKDAWK
jgi:predicted DNA-binding protein